MLYLKAVQAKHQQSHNSNFDVAEAQDFSTICVSHGCSQGSQISTPFRTVKYHVTLKHWMSQSLPSVRQAWLLCQ